MNSKKNLSLDSLSQDEQKLFNIYLNEYNDIFQTILLLPPCEFMHNVSKRVELTIRKKFNDISSLTREKVEEFLTEQVYSREYKYASMALKSVEKRLKSNIPPKIFNDKILEHCKNDKKNGHYIHSCGEPFYVFKYHPLNAEENKLEMLLVCIKCEMIYKSNLIKFHCNSSDIDFYSKVLNNNNKEKELPFATWKKYHCNAVINDTMKCPKCTENLYYDKEENNLICEKCDRIFSPNKISWNCLICKKDFIAEVKEYNNLEFKNMKICVKDTLLNKIKAKPEIMKCGCDIDINKSKFYHKASCKGELYLGEINKKKIVVCHKCDSLGFYDNFVWTCPKCLNKFKTNNNKRKDENKENNINNNNLRDSSIFKETNQNTDIKYKSGNKNEIFSAPRKNKRRNEKKEIEVFSSSKKNNFGNNLIHPSRSGKKNIFHLKEIPTPIDNNERGFKRLRSSNTPFINLKQNLANKFSNLEINNDSVKNLGNMFSRCYVNDKIYEQTAENLKIKDLSIKNSKNSFSTAVSSENNTKKTEDNLEKDNNNNKNFLNNNLNRLNSKKEENIEEYEKKKDFEVTNYIIKRQIGEGSFGKIFLVEGKEDGKLYALKKILAITKKDVENLQHEYDILVDIGKCEKNINLIKIYGMQSYQLDPTTFVLYVLMDLASTDWEKEVLFRQKKQKFYNENELLIILYDLVKTFAQLQRMNISHRDIKPQNILVFKGISHGYKLADFGEAKELLSNSTVTNKQTLRGTELYMSPILFQALRSRKLIKQVNHNTFKSDVFSFGLCALFAASLCYESLYDIRELTNNKIIRNIIKNYLKNHFSNRLIDLISMMLDVEEKTRCDFIELEKIFDSLNIC